MQTVGARPCESGGVLLGPSSPGQPPGEFVVTEFYFDRAARVTGVSYSPDHELINRLLREVWRPKGLECLGFVHSHPEPVTHLSGGDLSYIRRIFACNPGMSSFLAPIVIPDRFWLRPFVVHREPFRVEEAVLELFDPEAQP